MPALYTLVTDFEKEKKEAGSDFIVLLAERYSVMFFPQVRFHIDTYWRTW